MERESRYDRERRRQERERLLFEFRQYIEQNNPPILSDLKEQMKPLTDFGYATIPDLLIIVNAKISPFKVVNETTGLVSSGGVFDGLRMLDTRNDPTHDKQASQITAQNFYGPVGNVGANHGLVNATLSSPKKKMWENQFFWWLLGIPSALFVAYLTFRFGW